MTAGGYQVRIVQAARKQLDRLPATDGRRVEAAIQELADNPRPAGCCKLSGEDAWRIRVGMYRVIYEIHDDYLMVVVIRVAHRKDSYRP